MKRILTLTLLSLASAFALRADPQAGHKILVNKSKDGLAIHGFDAVSYFTDGRPVKGDARITSQHDGALYHFASQEHRALFESDPAKYAPAYGGFCGYAASIGKVRPANPLVWSIVDGQLVLQHTKGAAELWEKDVAGNKAKADRLWPRLIEVKAGKKDPIDGLFGKSALSDLN
ncbi:MAG: YHS domain-containing protein [Verrucomicrobiales bacterium]|nr:YHS domain-containing protein [Verrucomicrobiales bacterium]